jgi:ribosomal protein S18 acetylase RimI-like enzyme
MAILYTDSLEGIVPGVLIGFFEGWRCPPSPQKHLDILRGSQHVVLAVDDSCNKVVGFVNALADGHNSAFIPLLEVLPSHRHRGIGHNLMTRLLHTLRNYPCIDLTCYPDLQPFYESLGMQGSCGMVIREYQRATSKP